MCCCLDYFLLHARVASGRKRREVLPSGCRDVEQGCGSAKEPQRSALQLTTRPTRELELPGFSAVRSIEKAASGQLVNGTILDTLEPVSCLHRLIDH